MMIPFPAFTVCTSVYKNDDPRFVKEAIDSMLLYQTYAPNEIIMVVDGPISEELKNLIMEYSERYSNIFRPIFLEYNQGLGNALRIGVQNANYEYIARMDSDDICVPNRFEEQLKFIQKYPECDVVGGHIEEFIDNSTNIVGKRIVPTDNEEIYLYLKHRCPFNHMSIMIRKSAVMQVGNYMDWHYNEDYYLWIRMALAKCKFANLDQVLVKVRVGEEMYKRRGGWKYFKSEYSLQLYMFKHRIIGFPLFIYNSLLRFTLQVLMPNKLRGCIFQKFARQ